MSEPLTADDRLDILDVLARYCWALDTADPDALSACFAREGVIVWDTFADPPTWTGREHIRELAEVFRNMPGSVGRQHHLASVVIEGDRDGARVRAYVHVTDRKGEQPFPVRFAGWYDDRLVREDGRWLLAERHIRDWSGPVLARFPGETGERVFRERPPGLGA